jgi:hypothetical protein
MMLWQLSRRIRPLRCALGVGPQLLYFILSSAALGGPILQRGLRFAPSLRDSGLSVTMPGGGTRLGEEVKDGPHGDNRGGGNRFGVAPTAAPLRSRAGILRGSGLYTVLGRAFCTHPPWRGLRLEPSLRVARDLGRCDHDYPPVGRAHHAIYANNSPVLGAPASVIGSELPGYRTPALRFAPVLCCRVFLMYSLAASRRT